MISLRFVISIVDQHSGCKDVFRTPLFILLDFGTLCPPGSPSLLLIQ